VKAPAGGRGDFKKAEELLVAGGCIETGKPAIPLGVPDDAAPGVWGYILANSAGSAAPDA